MRRLLATAVLAIAVLALASFAGMYVYLRQSLPVIDGTISLTGPDGLIDIVRDRDAVPHILATTKHDALFGLGYVHAQDRLWEMEFQRRVGMGRLSEIFGEVTVPQDRFLRTVGFGRAARRTWEALAPAARAQIDAYVAGVNAFISMHHGRSLPPEFSLLRFEPAPWDGADVIVWVKMMAWDLSRNYTFELLRSDIRRAVGPQKMSDLMRPYDDSALNILSADDMPWLRRDQPRPTMTGQTGSLAPGAFDALVSALSYGHPAVAALLLGGATSDALGSNNWVVDGTMTASGRPLLANDPHLDAHIPSIWYLAHLSAGDFDVIGATLPGTPAVAIGRNKFIAWGETNVGADVEDLYREHLDPSGTKAEFRGQFEPLTLTHEIIHIKGGLTAEVDVRSTRHGPLVSDALNFLNVTAASRRHEAPPAPLEPLAFRWTALDADDTTIDAFLHLNEARNWSDFTTALGEFVVPAQNFVYADVDGHIGYYAPARIPIRAHGDGSEPAEGWTGDAEWTGWVPFDQLPHAYDPPEHFIVTANNRPAPGDYPFVLSTEWTEPFRAGRIAQLIRDKAAHGKLTPDDFASIQADTFSPQASSLLPTLLERVHPHNQATSDAVARLRRWNSDVSGDSAEAAIFEAWFSKLTPSLVSDELGALTARDYLRADRTSFVARFLEHTLGSRDNPWCDDVRTPQRETCDDIVTTSLDEAMADLTRRLGGDLSGWRWSTLHHAIFPHQGLDSVGLLRPFLSRSVPSAGDWSTVDVGATAADALYEQHAVPGYRQIVDLSPKNDSRFLDAVGQSGHFLSPHYADFLPDWRAVKHRPMRMTREAIELGAIGHLTLVPIR